MKKLFLTLFFTLVGCSKPVLYTVNSLAKFGDYTLTSDIHYGPDSANRLDVYQPERSAKGTIVFFMVAAGVHVKLYQRNNIDLSPRH